ncbi:MAG: PIN domain nuclease [Deferrisomatales bacterium]|nr:PIN domain nuclease [Deferrisomatales bacterium]
MKRVLVDTSVWVSFFRKSGGSAVQTIVQDALLEGRVVTCWVVQAELLVGTRTVGGFERLNALFSNLVHIPMGESLWDAVARLGFELRRKGLTVPLPDLLIAQSALAGGCELWHADRHYEAMSSQVTLANRSFL